MKLKTLGSLAAMLPLALPLSAPADEAHEHEAQAAWHENAPLVQKVRKATAKYRLINSALLGKEVDAETPDALIY